MLQVKSVPLLIVELNFKILTELFPLLLPSFNSPSPSLLLVSSTHHLNQDSITNHIQYSHFIRTFFVLFLCLINSARARFYLICHYTAELKPLFLYKNSFNMDHSQSHSGFVIQAILSHQ